MGQRRGRPTGGRDPAPSAAACAPPDAHRYRIRLSGVHCAYGGDGPLRVHALRGVDLDVVAGELLAVVGANGSGKSTMLHVMAGIHSPQAGSVAYPGPPSGSAGGSVPRPAMVFQDPDNQIIADRVIDDVAFGPRQRGVPAAQAADRARTALQRVGLADRAESAPSTLSGGERQRVAVAGALAAGADCLCLDEPTGSLDGPTAAALLRWLRTLCATGTVVFTTHDLREAAQADRVAVLSAGTLVACGDPGRVLADPGRLRAWNLRATSAQELGLALAERGLLLDGLPAGADALAASVLDAWRGGRRAGEPGPSSQTLPSRASPPTAGPTAPERTVGGLPGGSDPVLRAHPPSARVRASCAQSGIALREATVSYPGAASNALRSVSLVLPPGEALCILGANGAGKSTILLLLGGGLRPTAGDVLVDGVSPRPRRRLGAIRPPAHARPPATALVLQRPEAQFFSPTLGAEIGYAPRRQGLRGAELAARVAAAASAVGVGAADLGRPPQALSGGQQRRAAIAGALAAAPMYLLLDEPFAGLDAEGVEAVAAQIASLRERGCGVAWTAHSAEAARGADRVAVMCDGRLVADGPAAQVCADARLAGWGVVPPGECETQRALALAGMPVGPARAGIGPAASAIIGAWRSPDGAGAAAAQAVTEPRQPHAAAPVETLPSRPHPADRRPPLARVDPRALVAGTLIYAAVLLPVRTAAGFAGFGAFTAAALALAGVRPGRLLRAWWPLLPLLALTVAAAAFLGPPPAWRLGPVVVSAGGFSAGVASALRLVLLAAQSAAAAAAAGAVDLAWAGAELLRPLGPLGLPVDDVALMGGIALRFLPLISDEARRIAFAQRLRASAPPPALALLVPLSLAVFRRADGLALALFARGYNPRAAARTRAWRWGPADAVAATSVAALSAFAALVAWRSP